jgi:NAD(P)H-hydrate epimerase
MKPDTFRTPAGAPVPAVTAAEMSEVDRVAVDEFGLELLQMMENAGRALAAHVRAVATGPVTVLAGKGGNGGGGLCAARHLVNRGLPVDVVLVDDPDAISSAARTQYETLVEMDVPVRGGGEALSDDELETVVDAMVGYGLDGPLRGTSAQFVEQLKHTGTTIISLDVPSGLDATSGVRRGPTVEPERVVTLALPKTGLPTVDATLFLADIGIPAGVYESLDIPYASPFGEAYWVKLRD